MLFNLTLFPHLKALLPLHEKAGQQPDNLCGPYWLALLLQAYGQFSVSAVDVALAASTLLPSQGHPASWLPAGATSRVGAGYDRIPTVPDLDACGTAIAGLIHATAKLSESRFCLLPLQTEDWVAGLATLFDLCHTHPNWQAVPLLNLHTRYLWGSQLTPHQLFTHLQGETMPPPPADWNVGHFALLAGHLQSDRASLYAILDTYPHFGWQGLHLQPPDALAQSLQRPDLPIQGGIALFIRTELKPQITPFLAPANIQIATWDNGTPDWVGEVGVGSVRWVRWV